MKENETQQSSPVPRLVSVRSVLVGLVGVLFVNILTPFNDYIVNNTSLVGTVLPVAAIFVLLLITLGINVPLRLLKPKWALGQGEVALALGMTLVSCAIPGSALLKYVPAHIVGIWTQGAGDGLYRKVLDDMHLPTWMFPTTEKTDALSRARDPVIRDFIGRAQTKDDTFIEHFMAVPWHAWLAPAISYGLLYGSIFGIAIFLAVLVRRQWVENERLTFPLASLCVSLLEDPKPGRILNETFGSRLFWIALISVFSIHSFNALHLYFPLRWPAIPLEFNLQGMMTEPPWIYIDPWVLKTKITFIVIGITYFISSRIAFSIWACVFLLQPLRMFNQQQGEGWPQQGFYDHAMGAMIPYALMILWLGRSEWKMIIRRMFGQRKPGDPAAQFLPWGIAGWGLVVCIAGMMTWLLAAGAGWFGSTLLTVAMMVLLLVLMRIVAESGIIAIQFLIFIHRPWQYVFTLFPATATGASVVKEYFITCLCNVWFTVTQRESIGVFASHALQIAEQSAPQTLARRKWQGIGVVLALILALFVGYTAGGGSLLYFEYKYAATLDAAGTAPVNQYGVGDSATYALVDAARLNTTHAAQPESFNPLGYILSGAGVVTALSWLSLRFAWWPIHPLGYLMLFSWTTWAISLSLFLGWLAKVVVLRLGGASLYKASQPFFIGLIMGEVVAIGFWLVVSLVCLALGQPYHAIQIMPF